MRAADLHRGGLERRLLERDGLRHGVLDPEVDLLAHAALLEQHLVLAPIPQLQSSR